jgi:hypothetical protein
VVSISVFNFIRIIKTITNLRVTGRKRVCAVNLERNGLKDEEVAGRVDIGLGKNDQYYYYRLMLCGPMDTAINIGAINLVTGYMGTPSHSVHPVPRPSGSLRCAKPYRVIFKCKNPVLRTGFFSSHRSIFG